MSQVRLEELLKKKGIGPEGSKSLKGEELKELSTLFKDDSVSMTTKSTMLTALLLLDPNPEEDVWIKNLKSDPSNIPQELQFYIHKNPGNEMERIILKNIAKEDLTRDEAIRGMELFFEHGSPPYLQGAFLEAQRLKRETFVENKSFFETLWNRSYRKEIEIPVLIDICDSYDGCNRTKTFSVFIAALLASAGFPTYLHSIDGVAPKFGTTSNQVLNAAGKDPYKPLEAVAEDIINKDIAWGHVDQKTFFPQLFEKKQMRKEMVKRPFLATFEKLLQPIHNRGGNYQVTGYTHTHYREEVVNQLKDQNQCREAIILKGAEGSTQLSMTRHTVCIHYNGETITDSTVNPADFGIEPLETKQNRMLTTEDSLHEGILALQGDQNYAYHNILYTSLVILTKFRLASMEDARSMLIHAIITGKAYKHWQAGCK